AISAARLPAWSSLNFLMTAIGTDSQRWCCWQVSNARTGRSGSTRQLIPAYVNVQAVGGARAGVQAASGAAVSDCERGARGRSGRERRLRFRTRSDSALAQDHRRASCRTERDAAPRGALGLLGGRRQLMAREHLAQHDPHLLQGKACAEASPAASTERDPCVRPGTLAEKPLGTERIGVGIDARIVVHEECARQQQYARRVIE